MASEVLSTWSVKLAVDGTGMIQGFERAAANIKQFASFATTATKQMGSSLNSGLAAITSVNLGTATSQLQSMASAAIGIGSALATGPVGIAVAIGAAAASLVEFTTASMNAVHAQVLLGRTIGITASEAAGFGFISERFGVSAESASGAMHVWARRLGEIRQEVRQSEMGPMTIALQRMGIQASTFSTANISEQFAQLAERAQLINDPLEREEMLIGVLGRRAQEILPLFRAQAGELRNLGGLAERYGFSLTQSQAETISGAVRSMRELKAFVGGVLGTLGQQAALAWAPAVSAATRFFDDVLTRARPFFQAIVGGGAAAMVGVLAVQVGNFLTVMQWMMPIFVSMGRAIEHIGATATSVFATLKPVFVEFGESVLKIFGQTNVADFFAGLIDKSIPLLQTFVQSAGIIIAGFVVAVSAQIGLLAGAVAAMGEVANVLSGSALVGVNLAARSAEVRDATRETEASARRAMGICIDMQLPTIIPRLPGGSGKPGSGNGDSVLRMVDDLAGRMERMQSVLDSRNPFEKWVESLRSMQEVMQSMRDLDIDPSRAIEQIGANANAFMRSHEAQSRAPSAVMAGSVAAQNAIAQAQRQDRDMNRDPIDRLRAINQQMLEVQQQNLEVGRRILAAQERGEITVLGT